MAVLAPPTDLTRLSATELARRIRHREMSAREVVGAHIEVLERSDPTLNVLVHKRFEAARREAEEVDAMVPRRPKPRCSRRSSGFPSRARSRSPWPACRTARASSPAASTAPRAPRPRRGGSSRRAPSSSGSRTPPSLRSGLRPRTGSTDGLATPTTPSGPQADPRRGGGGDRLRRSPDRPRDRLRRLDSPSGLLQRHLRAQALGGDRPQRGPLPARAR